MRAVARLAGLMPSRVEGPLLAPGEPAAELVGAQRVRGPGVARQVRDGRPDGRDAELRSPPRLSPAPGSVRSLIACADALDVDVSMTRSGLRSTSAARAQSLLPSCNRLMRPESASAPNSDLTDGIRPSTVRSRRTVRSAFRQPNRQPVAILRPVDASGQPSLDGERPGRPVRRRSRDRGDIRGTGSSRGRPLSGCTSEHPRGHSAQGNA